MAFVAIEYTIFSLWLLFGALNGYIVGVRGFSTLAHTVKLVVSVPQKIKRPLSAMCLKFFQSAKRPLHDLH